MSFTTILADPPWNETGAGKIKRGADRHYKVMKTPAIISTMKQALKDMGGTRENAHLYLWVTNNFLKDGLKVVEALGFRYITNLVWVKEGNFGLGQYWRGTHELLLFAVKGKGKEVRKCNPGKGQTTVFTAPKAAHSKKPQITYEKIESLSQGPYLELFARHEQPGWKAWGNEIGGE